MTEQVRPAMRPLGQCDIAERWPAAASGVAGAGQTELPPGGDVERPAGEGAVGDDIAPGGWQPFAIEQPRGEGAGAVRVFGDAETGGQNLLPQRIGQPA